MIIKPNPLSISSFVKLALISVSLTSLPLYADETDESRTTGAKVEKILNGFERGLYDAAITAKPGAPMLGTINLVQTVQTGTGPAPATCISDPTTCTSYGDSTGGIAVDRKTGKIYVLDEGDYLAQSGSPEAFSKIYILEPTEAHIEQKRD